MSRLPLCVTTASQMRSTAGAGLMKSTRMSTVLTRYVMSASCTHKTDIIARLRHPTQRLSHIHMHSHTHTEHADKNDDHTLNALTQNTQNTRTKTNTHTHTHRSPRGKAPCGVHEKAEGATVHSRPRDVTCYHQETQYTHTSTHTHTYALSHTHMHSRTN